MPIPVRINVRFKLAMSLLWVLIPVTLAGASMLIWVNSDNTLLTRQESAYVVVSLSVVSMIGCVGLFLFCLLPMARRIERVSILTNQLAKGTFAGTSPDSTKDELGSVSRCIVQIANSTNENATRLERDKQTLSHQATHDELTGLSNRKNGNETIARLDSTASDAPTSILFLDLDGFKAVNDTCGHGVGDEILIAVAMRLKATLSKDCIPIRWGGDEFVIVLPGADQRAAISVAQDVADLFKHPYATSEGAHKLGCSIGLSTSRPNTSLEKVLEEADSNMYDQKKRRKKTITQNSRNAEPPLPDANWDQAA